MKISGLIFLAFLISLNAQAQRDSLNTQALSEKGTFQVGIGGLPIIYPGSYDDIGYSLRANIGYFPIKKLAVGLMPFAGKVDDMKSIGASIYLRYYLMNKKVSIFFEGGFGFGSLKYEDSPRYDGTMNSFTFGPGVHYSFKNKLAIELLFAIWPAPKYLLS